MGDFQHSPARQQQQQQQGNNPTWHALSSSHDGTGSDPEGSKGDDSSPAVVKLELVGSYSLSGVVESLAVLPSRVAGSAARDAVMMTFRDAKLSVIDWDPIHHTIRTTSLHSFEGDPALTQGRVTFAVPPRVATDPAGRCAAVVMFQHQMALLPALEVDQLDLLIGASAGDPDDITGGDPSLLQGSSGVGNSYVVNLAKMLGIHEVRDAVFLHGYTEPVLLLLHEPDPTWAARYRERKDTCAIAAVSINLRRKRHTLLWTARGLPSDCHKLLAVPGKPGVLVLSQSLIMYYSQGSSCAVAVSSMALPGEAPPHLQMDPYSQDPAAPAVELAREFAINVHPDTVPAVSRNATFIPGLEVDLASATAAWLSPTACLLSLTSGKLLALAIRFEGPVERRLQVVQTGSMSVAASGGLTALGAGIVFLGSWAGDSLLLRYSLKALEGGGSSSRPLAGTAAKRARTGVTDGDTHSAVGSEDGDGDRGSDGEEEGGGTAPHIAAKGAYLDPSRPIGNDQPSKYDFTVLDTLPGSGPILDLVHADTKEAVVSEFARGGPSVFACMGQGRSGAVALLRQGLLPDLVLEVPLASVHGLWAVYHRTEDEEFFDDADACMDHTPEPHPTLLLEAGSHPQPETITASTSRTAATAGRDSPGVNPHPEGEPAVEGGQPALDPSAATLDPGTGAAHLDLDRSAAGASADDPQGALAPSSGHGVMVAASNAADSAVEAAAGAGGMSVGAGSRVKEDATSAAAAAAAAAAPSQREQHHVYILISQAGRCTKVLSQTDELAETTEG
ncbi:MAG: hypothetical protein WDW36_002156 [Sanguina aurantia]